MEKLINEIYELYYKRQKQNYSIDENESKIIRAECEFKSELSAYLINKYEEFEFLSKKRNYENNLKLIEFVIEYLKTKKEEN